MFYVIAIEYEGPNSEDDRFIDADRICIRSEPARTNMSGEVRVDGWCGTTNDWSITAYGEYETIDEAERAVTDIFGETRDFTSDEARQWNAICVYARGAFRPLNKTDAFDYFYAAMEGDVTTTTSDEEIDVLAREYESLANDDGYTLDGNGSEIIEEFRDWLIEQAKYLNNDE